MEFYAQWRRQTGKPHPGLRHRPDITPYQAEIYRTFWRVNRRRYGPMGRRPLRFEDLEADARETGSPRNEDRLRAVWTCIRPLDDLYLELANERDKVTTS